MACMHAMHVHAITATCKEITLVKAEKRTVPNFGGKHGEGDKAGKVRGSMFGKALF